MHQRNPHFPFNCPSVTPKCHTRKRDGGTVVIDDTTETAELTEFMGFLALLTRRPTPDVIVQNLVHGYLEPLGIQRASLHVLDEDTGALRMVGDYGYPPQSLVRFTHIDRTVPLPVTDVLRGMSVLVFRPQAIRERYEALRSTAPDSDTADLGGEDCEWVFAPIHAGGKPVAVLAFLGDGGIAQSPRNLLAIQGVCHALALWISASRHLASGFVASEGGSEDNPLTFTERQLAILSCVEAGMSNEEIAHRLGCSRSTVKQELSKTMSALEASSRTQAAARAREYGLLSPPPPIRSSVTG